MMHLIARVEDKVKCNLCVDTCLLNKRENKMLLQKFKVNTNNMFCESATYACPMSFCRGTTRYDSDRDGYIEGDRLR